MTQVKTHATRRDELIEEIGKKHDEVTQRIERNNAAWLLAHREAKQHADRGDNHAAHNKQAEVGQLREEIRKDEATLRQLELDRQDVVRGSHPELACLTIVHSMKANKINQDELASARADFLAAMTPEVKAAAQRYVTASQEADPLAPVPTLADMIAEAA